MKLNALIVIGVLFIAAGITGLVHPQWQGEDKKMDVQIANHEVVVNTRRIVDIPPVMSGAVIVAGLAVIGLGAIGLSRPKRP